MATKNFKDKEFACKCCGKYIPNSELQAVAELLRLKFGGRVIINSGTRCEKHNQKVGGKKNSKHKLGLAGDLVVENAKPIEVFNYLNDLFPNFYGIAAYQSKGFCHVDVDPRVWREVYD